jgi:hypothetical protein
MLEYLNPEMLSDWENKLPTWWGKKDLRILKHFHIINVVCKNNIFIVQFTDVISYFILLLG